MMSTATPLMTDPPVALRAGADLREARERLGWSLHEMAATLRIRMQHLEALEEGRVSLLPGNAYALAFMRTYANALGLDSEEIVRRFKSEAAEVSRRTELVFPIPMPDSGFPAGAVLLLGIVLAIGAYAGWYRLSGEGRLPAETVIAIPERLAPLAEQALPPLPPSQADVPAGAQVSAATPGPGAPMTGAPMTGAPPTAAPVSPISAAAAPVANPLPAAVTPLPEDSRIVVRASADAWIMVKDRSGAVLFNRVLKQGETWPVPARPDLLLTTGNAGGTDILLDGAGAINLGNAGSVRRDLPLDPQSIKDGKLAAAPVVQARPRQ
jgi:cytoskeleton protein RodZ